LKKDVIAAAVVDGDGRGAVVAASDVYCAAVYFGDAFGCFAVVAKTLPRHLDEFVERDVELLNNNTVKEKRKYSYIFKYTGLMRLCFNLHLFSK
jgi:hypothetical protein